MVAALTDLDDILKSLRVLNRGTYVYLPVEEVENLAEVLAVINEGEGSYAVAPATVGGHIERFACLTLDVHSALTSVGLTALVSTVLADAGIACNVIAGYYHDHLLVPEDKAEQAQALLAALPTKNR
ncbi:ACT domain-containing protein [Brevibacterium sp. HMSC07C04]|uniref:ACT domain-containing protein n=1 Tax=Brevibacterium sp. HMSC07C04 TaxID=1581130 RepID=UPI0008A2370F|nr:ACT domain-containing protein [Brevibacterium sp. HMSC07C04]